MGRGSSKIGGGGGGGSQAAQTPKQTNTVIQSFVDALNSPGRWTQQQRSDLASAIYANTDVGDQFVVTMNNGATITFTKTGTNTWTQVDNSRNLVLDANMDAGLVRTALLTLVDFGKVSFR